LPSTIDLLLLKFVLSMLLLRPSDSLEFSDFPKFELVLFVDGVVVVGDIGLVFKL
jgi:hypothetical protein